MPEDNPNLIPLPSIGESKTSKAASGPNPDHPKRSKLWMVVVACIVAGVGLGVFVYQQSIAPTTVKKSPRPAASLKPSVAPSPVTPEISQVTPQSNTILFPKAGEVRVYFAGYGTSPTVPDHIIKLVSDNGQTEVKMPATVATSDKAVIRDSGLTVTAGQSVTISSFDRGNLSQPSFGWIAPNTGKCGTTNPADASAILAWITQKAGNEPLVSIQCWADWNQPNDTTPRNFNDFLVVLSYTPTASASVNPSPSAIVTASSSPAASKSPSPSPAASKSPSPSPAASKSPSPSPAASKSPSPSPIASKSPSPAPSDTAEDEYTEDVTAEASPRVTMPEGSALPDAGIFEVTAGTMGIGLVFILLGILGLMIL